MPATEPYALTLTPGERYRFNFPGCPAGVGEYLGTVDVSGSEWLALNVYDRNEDEQRVTFYNPAHLCTLEPESDPLRLAG